MVKRQTRENMEFQGFSQASRHIPDIRPTSKADFGLREILRVQPPRMLNRGEKHRENEVLENGGNPETLTNLFFASW